jgi:hypothetical protein
MMQQACSRWIGLLFFFALFAEAFNLSRHEQAISAS